MGALNSNLFPTGARDEIPSPLTAEPGGHSCRGEMFRLSFPTPCAYPPPCGGPCDLKLGPERHALVNLGELARMAILGTAPNCGSFEEQARELFAQIACIMAHHPTPLTGTTMMVFLRDSADEAKGRELLQARFGTEMPVVTFVTHPPCDGSALAVELWAAGGAGVKVNRISPQLLTVESEGIRWIHCGGAGPAAGLENAYAETISAFEHLRSLTAQADIHFDQVVRTWLYVNQINEGPEGRQRYQELNRARTDFYGGIRFGVKARAPGAPETIYPASTGIGTNGTGIRMACLALDSARPDVYLMPLENPLQTPAFDYQASYSPKSPKFSRAMAVVQGHFVTTLVSGTASILNSRTCHPCDIVAQTRQTIDNIEQLIAAENFARHGLTGAGATLRDLAKLRVYIKQPEHYEACRAICEQRLPGIPALYLQAEVCRPELLMEIEAVTFTPLRQG